MAMAINKELLKGSTTTMILALLEKKSMYGYEIIKEMDARSDGVFVFKEGTLYPILHSLEQGGMLQSCWIEAESGRRRKYYQITDHGRTQLKNSQAEWSKFRSAVDQVLGEVY